MAEPTASPSPPPPLLPPPPARAPRSPWRRAGRALAWVFAALLLAIALALGGAWWWAGQADSLASLITRVARWLPEDQTLEARDVSGTLREGGHIGWLRWRGPTLSVEVESADLGWQLQPLLQREVKVGKLHAKRVEIHSTPDPEKTPTEPLQQLRLPVRIELPFEIDQLVWSGPPRAEIQQLQGNYRYDGRQHRLEVARLDWADGSYRAQLQLQAEAPMQLQAQLSGHLEAPLPDGRSQAVDAEVKIEGTLATEAASLNITADAQAPAGTEGPAPSAHATAVVRPWLEQPLEQAEATFEQFDVASFWADGPRTLLSGNLKAGPEAEGAWALQTELRNAQSGPWDKQRLPLDRLQAQVRFAGGVWEVRESRAEIGTGQVALQGRFTTATKAVEGRADVTRLNPAALYSTLDAAPLQGRIEATTREDQSVSFVAALQADGGRARRAGQRAPLAIERLNATGLWQAPLLRLSELDLQALQARVRSSRVEVDTETLLVSTRAQAEVPGGRLDIDGQLGRTSGAGKADLAIASAPALLQWLRGLPGVADPLAGASLEGQGQLALQWQGGWGGLQQRLQAAAGQLPTAPTGLQLQARLDVPNLRYLAPGAEALAVQGLLLNVRGTPEQAQIELQGQARQGERNVQLSTALEAGLARARSAAPADWQARITRLQAGVALGKEFPGIWALQLQSPLQLRQTSPGGAVRSTQFEASASALSITPPAPFKGQSRIEWQDGIARSQPQGLWAVKTQGRLLAVPIAWADALGVQNKEGPLERSGLSGDLRLNGSWNIDTTGAQLQADATLERADGDLRLAIDDEDTAAFVRSSGPSAEDTSGNIAAGVRPRAVTLPNNRMFARIQQARLDLRARGNEVTAQLNWASGRAGNVQAQLGTRLAQNAEGWSWPEDAPLGGSVKAQMPDVGIWSLFAPPGWRASGTFSADATLSGTRLDPRWQGTLQARRLGITSLLDGVDLRNGSLDGRFSGNQLDITSLRLEGGQGSSARILGYSGNLTAAPVGGGELVGQGTIQWDKQGQGEGSGLRMQFNAEARRLQVLVRADRQLSVSGNLQARLDAGQWTLRGRLTADRAAILLPEDSAPTLDSDVIVRSAASRRAEQEAKARQTRAQAETAKPPDIAVSLDLGRDFALQGFGITTRLVGQLDVLGPAQPGGPPRITGEVRTEQGRYRAWGQSLDVETGIVRFNGSYDNPSLDILAIRPNIAVRAGVQVTGSARDPRVRLYSDPELPDAEKLSWVVMGRDPAEGGAEAAFLQQAALALLSGGGSGENFAGRVGLDEIGFKGPGSNAAGEDSPALTLGKRLSTNLYVTYEQSLSGAMGTLYIFYDLSRRLTLRGQTGEKSAVDLIYTVRRD
ncbi:translocation/assembly module TamB domain-containing protein [Comamonas endophytica]|uniref:translocation/assembly module TamB domain-containing protein n=1 Tax=Comamonas endophytica TaxID=2949090 RepID=UPI00361267FF